MRNCTSVSGETNTQELITFDDLPIQQLLQNCQISTPIIDGVRKLILESDNPERLRSLNGRFSQIAVAARDLGFYSVIFQSADKRSIEIRGEEATGVT